MGAIDATRIVGLFDTLAATMADKRDWLCELDGVIGDADHGITMELGFSTVKTALAEAGAAGSDLGQVFNLAAKAFLNAVGASSGPLYATAFMRAGAALKGKAEAGREEMVAALAAMAKGIEDRGKALPGEKTMVDAWRPAADAAQKALETGADLAACLTAAAEAAEAGAAATAGMVATKGRASRLGERALGHVDPGAASAALVVAAFARSLS